jgi:hypothetical protein
VAAKHPEPYLRLCWRKAILLRVHTFLEELLPDVSVDAPEIWSEDLPHDQRQVPQTVLVEHLSALYREVEELDNQIGSYNVEPPKESVLDEALQEEVDPAPQAPHRPRS